MKNPRHEGERVIFAEPFEQYLAFCDEKMDDFINYLLVMNTPEIKRFLDPLFHYGLIDILLPLNELVPYLLENEDQKNWWKELIKSMENSQIVYDFEDDFHSVITNSRYYLFNSPIDYIWDIRVNYRALMQWSWDTVKDKTLDTLINNKDLIGFIIPSLFSNALKRDFLSLLDVYTLPKLLSKLSEDISFTIPHNTNERAALKHIVRITTIMLDDFYYSLFMNKCYIILKAIDHSEKGFYKLQNDDLRRLLFLNSRIDDYINSEYLNRIDSLISYADIFKSDGIYDASFKLSSVLLHQCIGENDKSYSLLHEIFRKGSARIRYSAIYLIAAFRAVSQTRYDDRDKFRYEMILLWNNDDLPDSLYITLKSIVEFFRKFTEELLNRFHQKEFQVAIANVSADDDRKALYTISPYLFENFGVVNRLQQYVEIIKDKKRKFSERLYNLSLFRSLFESLVSHIGRDTRIDTRGCLQYMWMDQYPTLIKLDRGITEHLFKEEIFHVYSYKDEQRLKELNIQLKKSSSDLPSFVTVQMFEKLIFDEDIQISSEDINIQFEKMIENYNKLLGVSLETNSRVYEIDRKTDDFYEFLCSILSMLRDVRPDDTEVIEKLEELKMFVHQSQKGVGNKAITVLGVLGSVASIASSPQAKELVELLIVFFRSLGLM